MIVDTGNAVEIVNPVKNRKIICAFHDIDGTHSLIRDWPPVMSRVLYDTVINGIPKNLMEEENINRLVSLCGTEALKETDRFCEESAGLSAITQMEWALRRNQEQFHGPFDSAINSEIIKRIWAGEEKFEEMEEPRAYMEYLNRMAPKLFWVYEQVLNRFCRDRNLKAARKNPRDFLVPGSMEFMKYLYQYGVKNYFVTGAVVDKSLQPPIGIYEEVLSLGFEIGRGKTVEDILGSTWEKKIPKNEVMFQLVKDLGIAGENVLVVGDGRSEISAGVKLGAVTVSVLPQAAKRQRELHKELGTNIIISDYKADGLMQLFNNG